MTVSSEDSKEISGSVPSIISPKVEGSIVAETVRIFGTVNGWVRAKTVLLDKTGKVIGDIAHEILAIEAGAVPGKRGSRLGSQARTGLRSY